MADLFRTYQLFRNQAGQSKPASADELKGKVVAIFFGIKEVNPELIAKLKEFYVKAKPLGFEMVFISLDINENNQKAFLGQLPDLLFTKYGDPKTKSLLQRYQLTEVPLVMVVQKGGTPLADNVNEDIKTKDPVSTVAAWKKQTTE